LGDFLLKKIFVITGPPGSGKTAIIAELERRGFSCGEEVARDVIREMKGKGLSPLKERTVFGLRLLEGRIKQFKEAKEGTWFFDRGIPDIVAYLKAFNFGVPPGLSEACEKYRYEKKVFLTEPWECIFSGDGEREEAFGEAVKVSAEIKRVYARLGYTVVPVPKESVSKRADFVLEEAGKR
jgi:predicted ATPase